MTQNSNTILVVEDEQDIRELMSFQLKAKNYHVETAASAEQALNLVKNQQFHLFIIDRMLPQMSGIKLCKKLREDELTKTTPIIFVTALTQTENIVEGLEAGADDYITKPYDQNIFLARVKAQLRREQNKTSEERLDYNQLSIEVDKAKVCLRDEELKLTHTEFKILSILALKPGKVFSREFFIANIQGDSVHVTNRTIDTHVAGLRKKLADHSDLVETIRGIGYRFKEL